jgi:hypothetical protein
MNSPKLNPAATGDSPRHHSRRQPFRPRLSAPSLSTAPPSGFCARPAATCRSTATSASTTRWSKSASSPIWPLKSPSPPLKSSASMRPSSLPTCCCPSNPWACPSSSRRARGPWCITLFAPPKTFAPCAPTAPADLAYVARAIEKVAAHFRDRLGIIGFCGAPYTLASYMIEGGGSKNYIYTKQMMYRDPLSWRLLLDKLVKVLKSIAASRSRPALTSSRSSTVGSVRSASPTIASTPSKPPSAWCVRSSRWASPSSISASRPRACSRDGQTGADVIGLDWRQPLDEGWRAVGHGHAVQGNLDPITLFAPS